VGGRPNQGPSARSPQVLIVDPNAHAPLDIRRGSVPNSVCVMLLGPSVKFGPGARDYAYAAEGTVQPFRDYIAARCDQQVTLPPPSRPARPFRLCSRRHGILAA